VSGPLLVRTSSDNSGWLEETNSYIFAPDTIDAAHRALNTYGLGSGGSRWIAGTTHLHTRAEELIVTAGSASSTYLPRLLHWSLVHDRRALPHSRWIHITCTLSTGETCPSNLRRTTRSTEEESSNSTSLQRHRVLRAPNPRAKTLVLYHRRTKCPRYEPARCIPGSPTAHRRALQ
jgi:hypothetical protein